MKEHILQLLDDFMQLFKGYRKEGEERDKEDDAFNVIVFFLLLFSAAVAVYLKTYQ